ncbi:MAG: AI-2E family transporter [Acidobacteriales bacterium]|nr:AI-2E family transporter [Terriglobales bacterium]
MPEKQRTRVAEEDAPEEQVEKASSRQESGKAPRDTSDHVGSILASQIVTSVAVVLTICYFAKLVLVTILVSILIAYMLEPLVSLQERFRINRAVGAAVAILVLGALLYSSVYFGYSKGLEFVQELPKYSEKIKRATIHVRKQAEKLQQTTEGVLPETEADKQAVKVQQQPNWSELMTRYFGTVGEVLLVVSFIPFLVFFMLTWQDHVRAATVMLFSMENRNTAYVTLGRISEMVRGFINGNVVIGLFVSLVSVGIFWMLHLPYFYFIGFISGFLSIVPYLGVILAMLPPLVAGFGVLQGPQFITIIVTVFALHVFAINVLYPKLLGKRLQLNPLAVTIALLVWGWLWGAMGMILAVPITAAMKIVFDNVDSLRAYGAWLGE